MTKIIYVFAAVFLISGLAACSEAGNAVPAEQEVGNDSAVIDDTITPDPVVLGADDLQDIEWVLIDMNQTAPVTGSRVTVTFANNGSLYGSAGCNRYSGNYKLDGNAITVDPAVASTMMACAEDVMAQEESYHKLFTDIETWSLAADGSLQLETGDHKVLGFTQDRL